MRMKPVEARPELLELLRKSADAVKKMTPVQRFKMIRRQAKSWARQDRD
jgi:hypothetical protein